MLNQKIESTYCIPFFDITNFGYIIFAHHYYPPTCHGIGIAVCQIFCLSLLWFPRMVYTSVYRGMLRRENRSFYSSDQRWDHISLPPLPPTICKVRFWPDRKKKRQQEPTIQPSLIDRHQPIIQPHVDIIGFVI